MPHALLLSPDDQVVSAISGVLEEMSVTCERPLDGTSAAQKLNSQTFDLVLVDCENLPAAKLIFDVCRRGKNGHNPIPIAIVDGRAGLPTAFRLGAELILTKPVAKDQARTTIRTAVGRVRKDVAGSEPIAAPSVSAPVADQHAPAMAKAASPPLTSCAEPLPKAVPNVAPVGAVLSGAAVAAAVAPAFASPLPSVSSVPSFSESLSTPTVALKSQPKPPAPLSDDPVLAELEMTELAEAAQLESTERESAKLEPTKSESAKPASTKPAPATREEPTEAHGGPVFSSYSQRRQKPRGALVALLVLALAAAGFYAVWMYQPGFRTTFQATVQPQIDRALALIGMALPPTQSPAPAKPVAATAPLAVPAAASPSPAAINSTPLTNSDSATNSATSTPDSATAPSTPTTAATVAVAGPSTPAASPTAAATNPAPAVNKPQPVKSSNSTNAAATTSDALPGENSAIILSSKGAEKRLAHSVAPKYPADARSSGAEGTVVLKEVVDENGRVAGVRLVEGDAKLAPAAMEAVKQWRYRPYVRDGKVAPFQTVVILDFQRP